MQLTYLLLFTMIASVSCLSGSEVAAFCTCNLTASFCDFNCCCDTDCSNVTLS